MTDAQLKAVLKANQVVDPATTLAEARRTGLPLAYACSLLEQESSGGHNVFGHDYTHSIPEAWKGGPVTLDRYRYYLAHRNLGYQGVGPTQLTWGPTQDVADKLGGCHRAAINMRVGFGVLRANIHASGLRQGLARYNGSGPYDSYTESMLRRIQRWEQILAVPPQAQDAVQDPHGPTTAEFVGLCLHQRGKSYVYGAEAAFSDPNPTAFDCSELVEWAAHRIGLTDMPDGSTYQEQYCRSKHTMISVETAFGVQGALIFRHIGENQHVVVSLGNGSTIEARGRDWGVNIFPARGRVWTAAARVPGLRYVAPIPIPDGPNGPRWPGRYLMQPPEMRGDDVLAWQRRMRARGWQLGVDGAYGPESEKVCREFQQQLLLEVDGIVGPDTWRAAWTAPMK
jgi:Putative peptidoglycan binding domain/NlpC/P60 family